MIKTLLVCIKRWGGYSNRLKSRSMGILTGLSSFDEMVSGLKPQKLYIFAARPNEGKTSLITQMLTHIAEQGKTCLFYPTEVGFEPIIDKIVSKKTGLNLKKFQNGSFISEDFTKIDKVKNDVAKLPLIVVEDFGVNIGKIEEGIKNMHQAYLPLISSKPLSGKTRNLSQKKLKQLENLKSLPVTTVSRLSLLHSLIEPTGSPTFDNLRARGRLRNWVMLYHSSLQKTSSYIHDLSISL